MKYVLCILVTVGLLAQNISAQSVSLDDAEVIQSPEFPGGTAALSNYLMKYLKYPEKARKNGVQGTVVTQFIVDTTGQVTEVVAVKKIGSGCDEEAIRVIKAMPKWKPARRPNGQKVAVQYAIPVRFYLSDDDEAQTHWYKDIAVKPRSPVGDLAAVTAALREKVTLTKSEKKSIKGKKIPLVFTIGATGEVLQCDANSSIPRPIVDKYCAALKALGQWTPGQHDNQPVQTVVDLEIPK